MKKTLREMRPVYVVGIGVAWWLPETKGQALPE